MKTLLLVTYVDFWTKGSGHRTRINSLVDFLKEKVHITVFFAGAKEQIEAPFLKNRYPEVDFEYATSEGLMTFRDCREQFARFINGKYFDFALIEYLELSIILEYLPESTKTLLDTHDLLYKKIASFKNCNLPYDGIMLTEKEEIDFFKCFDYIMLIQKSDYQAISVHLDENQLLLVPHGIVLEKKILRNEVENLGYVASIYQPNIDALNWFIHNIWDKINRKNKLMLHVYGTINLAFLGIKKIDIVFHGIVDDIEEIYRNVDLIINPIRCGGGLKIKNVEALGHGIPLITTSHGAIGMEDGAKNAFLVADTIEQYILALEFLIKNYDARLQLSNNAFKYAQDNFSIRKCYERLLQIIS